MHIEQKKKLMYSYRITKYDPKNRNQLGHYQKEDWIGVDDVGRKFFEKILTLEEYLKVEEAYAQSLIIIMDFLKLESLALKKFSKLQLSHPELLSRELLDTYNNSFNNEQINKEKVTLLTKLLLREEVVGIFQSSKMFVRFDCDYYMFVGTSKKLSNGTREKIKSMGLFVENTTTSYFFDIEEEQDF